MKMLWYKAWLECRMRFILALLLTALLVVNFAFLLPAKLSKTPASQLPERVQIFWTTVFVLYLGILVPVAALLLAGSGINPQTDWGKHRGLHPSMIYALALPVSRGELLVTRAGLGAGLTAVVVIAAHCALVYGTRSPAAAGEQALQMAHLPRVLLWSMAFYAISLWLAAVFDELWSGMIGLAVAGGFTGYAMAGGARPHGLVAVVLGGPAGQSNYAVYLMLGAIAVLLALSYRAVQRKQY